jgi:hypothetical protein
MSRTALDGYVLGDAEKDYLLEHYSSIYFAEILGFCLMGNHFHLVVRMHPGDNYSDAEIGRRLALYYLDDEGKRELLPGQIPTFRDKWQNLSELIKEIKQAFSRYYNKRHNRRGFFRSDRFKSLRVENGETINCLGIFGRKYFYGGRPHPQSSFERFCFSFRTCCHFDTLSFRFSPGISRR